MTAALEEPNARCRRCGALRFEGPPPIDTINSIVPVSLTDGPRDSIVNGNASTALAHRLRRRAETVNSIPLRDGACLDSGRRHAGHPASYLDPRNARRSRGAWRL